LWNEEGIVLEQIDGLHNFSFKVKPGLRFPLHTSAPGKAYLASLPDTESKQIIARLKLTRFTPKTITTQAKLHKELKEVRQLVMRWTGKRKWTGKYVLVQ